MNFNTLCSNRFMSQQKTSGKQNEITFATVRKHVLVHSDIIDLRLLVMYRRKGADEIKIYWISALHS